MKTIDSGQQPIRFTREMEAGSEPQTHQHSLVKGCKRFWKQGKMVDWAVLFFITATLAAIAGYLVGSPDSFFNYAWLLSIASLVMGVVGLFMDTRYRE